jgi:SAM-dependent methyltransferase
MMHTLDLITAPAAVAPFAMRLICPVCKGALAFNDDRQSAHCIACSSDFARVENIWDFTLGTTFEDGAIKEEQKLYEGQANADTAHRFWLPVLRQIVKDVRRPRVLSVGCGVGIDVDVLCDEGVECFGIDCGHRGSSWTHRTHSDHLLLANGLHLPFEDNSFDVVFCGCVFPHVGTQGDTNIMAEDGHDQRASLAREMVRVLRPRGTVIASSPNRWFPADLFHGRGNGGYKPRLNLPTSKFLLSAGDYKRLFSAAGCRHPKPLPVRKYWGFIRSKHGLKGRLLSFPIKVLFWLAEVPLFRTWPLNPWIIISMQKRAA